MAERGEQREEQRVRRRRSRRRRVARPRRRRASARSTASTRARANLRPVCPERSRHDLAAQARRRDRERQHEPDVRVVLRPVLGVVLQVIRAIRVEIGPDGIRAEPVAGPVVPALVGSSVRCEASCISTARPSWRAPIRKSATTTVSGFGQTRDQRERRRDDRPVRRDRDPAAPALDGEQILDLVAREARVPGLVGLRARVEIGHGGESEGRVGGAHRSPPRANRVPVEGR